MAILPWALLARAPLAPPVGRVVRSTDGQATPAIRHQVDSAFCGTWVYSRLLPRPTGQRKSTAGSPLAPSYPRRAQEPTPLPEARLQGKPTLTGKGVKLTGPA